PASSSPLFPYTTLFRSVLRAAADDRVVDRHAARVDVLDAADDGGVERAAAGIDVEHRTAAHGGAGGQAAGQIPGAATQDDVVARSEEHTSELQSPDHLV